jgi:hypothetical protein
MNALREAVLAESIAIIGGVGGDVESRSAARA